MIFLSTVSTFLIHIIRHNVDICKNELRFMPMKGIHSIQLFSILNLIILLTGENEIK